MWFLFKILHAKGRNTCFCKGDLCFILLGGVFTSLLFLELLLASCTPVLWPFLHTLYLFSHTYTHTHTHTYIYMMMYVVLHLSLHMLFLFYFYAHASYILYAIYYFYLTLRCLDEFCLKCFKKTGCENLSCHELSSCKVFQEFVLELDLFVIHKCYEFSDLRLLSWFICLLWFCHEL